MRFEGALLAVLLAGCSGGSSDDGSQSPASCNVQPGTGAGAPLGQPTSMALDTPACRLYVAELELNGVVAVDLATGNRTLVTHPTLVGAGPPLGYPSGLALDNTSRFVYVADPGFGGGLRSLVRVDVATGNRVLVSGPSVGDGPALGDPWDVALEESRRRAYVVDRVLDAVVRIDLATGDRVTLSHEFVGFGPAFVDPYSLAADFERGRVLVAE